MPSANVGEAVSTLRRGGISLSTSAQKTIGLGERIHLKIKHQTLSVVWQQLRGREQVDAPSPGDDSRVLQKWSIYRALQQDVVLATLSKP